MRNPNCHMPYTAHGLKELSNILRLHRKIAWVDPVSNQIAVKKSYHLSDQTQYLNSFS